MFRADNLVTFVRRLSGNYGSPNACPALPLPFNCNIKEQTVYI